MDFIRYKQKMAQVNNGYDELGLVVRAYNENLYNEIQKNKHAMQEEAFQLVVVGEFSRGKSTFVNALLGHKILPAKLKPTTAVLTKVVYRDTPSYKLHYFKQNAKDRIITEEEFLQLVAPKEVDKSNKNLLNAFFSQQKKLDDIEHVEVGYPLALCRDNVEIVDTPGTNDLSTTRLDITYNYLNKADAVIMLLSANQALTASELEFLKERVIGNQIKDIFFVISYKDKLKTEQDQKMVLDFVRQNLLAVEGMPRNLRVHLVSSQQALCYRRNANGEALKPRESINLPADMSETGFVELEAELARFLSEEKGNAKLAKYVARGQNMARQMYEDLSVQLELVSHSADELNEKIARMKPEFEQAKADVERYTQQMKNNLRNGVSELRNACTVAGNEIRRAANNVIDYACVDDDGNLDKNLSSDIERAVHYEKKQLIENLESIQNELVETEVERIDKKMRKIWQDLEMDMGTAKVRSSVMGINSGGMELQISTYSGGTSIQEVFGAGMMLGGAVAIIAGAALGPALILGAIGAWLFDSGHDDPKAKARRDVNKHYSEEMESISKSVTANFCNQIDNICDEVQSNVKSRLVAMEDQLQQALAQKRKQESEARAEQERLLAHKQKLEQIYKGFAAAME